MQESRVSVTALVTAYARAYHATYDDPKIFDDFIAPQLFTAMLIGMALVEALCIYTLVVTLMIAGNVGTFIANIK